MLRCVNEVDVAARDFRSNADVALTGRSKMFHSSNPTLFGRPSGVLAQAESLRTTIVALRSLSSALIDEKPEGRGEARRLLSDFSATLSMYFDVAEGSRYFRAAVADCPMLEAEVARLGRGHDSLRDSVASLRRLAHDGTATAELGRGIVRVIDEFEQRETAENALLQQVFSR